MQDCGFQYVRRQPETTVLYQVVAGELETFLIRQQERDHAVPRFVEDEFRSYLDCGILARGFVRVHCPSCGRDRLVAFSCKGRGWCPSCGGRKMAETAAHLVERVFPVVPVRQWVLSLPFALRYRIAYDSDLMARILTIFIRVLFAELRRRAGELLGVCSAQCGAVTFVQRFGDALNVNPHFHTLVIDGVYAASENGMPEFHALPPPEDEEVWRVASRVAEKILAFVERHASNSEEADPLSSDDPGTAMLLANSIRRNVAVGTNRGMPVSRIGDRIEDRFQLPLHRESRTLPI